VSVITTRAATRDDVSILLDLVRQLAAFERMPDAVRATEEDLVRDGFGAIPRFEARLAFMESEPVGLALFFTTYSTWEGRPGLFLEDIFVAERARRQGVGRRLIADLAALALERGYKRFDLSVLDWNPARQFYERLGIGPHEGWLPYRASGEALRALAR